jgi:hypothetical protein
MKKKILDKTLIHMQKYNNNVILNKLDLNHDLLYGFF